MYPILLVPFIAWEPMIGGQPAPPAAGVNVLEVHCTSEVVQHRAALEEDRCVPIFRDKLETRLKSKLASGAIVTDLLQAMGQVVLDKATEAGWDLLRRRLRDLSCQTAVGGTPLAAATCELMNSDVRIQDLMAQPEILLRAVLTDFVTYVGPTLFPPIATDVLAGLSPAELWDAWRRNGIRGLESAARHGLADALLRTSETTECPDSIPSSALWAIGRWLALGEKLLFADILERCEKVEAGSRSEIVRVFAAHRTVFDGDSENGTTRERAREVIGLLFELLKLADSTQKAALDDARELLTGMLESDWTRTTAAASRRIAAAAPQRASVTLVELEVRRRLGEAKEKPGASPEDFELTGAQWAALRGTIAAAVSMRKSDSKLALSAPQGVPVSASQIIAQVDISSLLDVNEAAGGARTQEQERARGMTQLVKLLAGVGRYAASYSIKDAEAAATARKDAIADIVSQMASRRERTRGFVWSLGGSLAGVVGFRDAVAEPTGLVWASPVHLGIGFAADSYHRSRLKAVRDMGLHLEVMIVDLGQYVVFDREGLKLERPDLKAALSPSAKIAWRFAGRAIPGYLGAFAAVTPFIVTEYGEQMTWTFGGVLGVYIPFIDFN